MDPEQRQGNKMAAGIGIAVVVIILLIAASAFGLFNGSRKEVTNDQGNTMNEVNQQFPEGLQVQVLEEGTGEGAQQGDLVTVNYEGRFQDGTVFDSSYQRGEPITFLLGAGQVISGWDQGLIGMRVGEVRELTIAPELAYGQEGYGSIPGNATLIFTVEMVGISEPTGGK